MTKEQIKSICDAMSFLNNLPDLQREYGEGCIETELQIHKEFMEMAGVDQNICEHFDHIVYMSYLMDPEY